MSPFSAEEFAALLAKARSGCYESLGRLLNAFVPLLRAKAQELSHEYLAPFQTPSDFCQNAALEAFLDFHRFQGDTVGEFQVWLLTILRHDVQDWIRKCRRAAKRRRTVPLDNPEALPANTPAPDEEAERNERSAACAYARNSLPWQQRLVVRLRYVEKKSFAETGAAMGISEDAAYQLCMRAVARLKQALEQFHASAGSG